MTTFADGKNKITYFAETDYRSRRIKFGIQDDDRARHMYVIGKTGMGKSTLLENLAIQDIRNGEGLCFIDPHGGTAETLLSYVPEYRIKDVVYFAPFDQEYPIALNVMEDLGRDKRSLIASGLIGAFKKVWIDAWSPRMEYLLNNALLALFETPNSTLLGVNRMFADKNYRSMIVANVQDPSVKAFWTDEYAKYSDKFATEATAAIQNKVGQFAANPIIRNIVGQPKSTFDIRTLMDEKKIFIVNLSKGRLGEGNANLIGSMLITKIYLAAMSRAEVGAEAVRKLPPFYLYVDEFQSFANESFADILSEARKYKLSLTIAHQYIEQMSDEVRAAVFGNVGTMISFRVGSYDAEVLEKEFAPAFTAEDMVNLGFAQIYLKLMINGVGSSPFSATTLPRPPMSPHNFVNDVVAASRAQFARPRAEVEEEIRKWHEPVPEPSRDPNAPKVPETRKYAPGTRPLRSEVNGAKEYVGERESIKGGEEQVVGMRGQTPYMERQQRVFTDDSGKPIPAYDVFGGTKTQKEEEVHQPFKSEFKKITEISTDVSREQITEQQSAPSFLPNKEKSLRIHPERVVMSHEYHGPERRHATEEVKNAEERKRKDMSFERQKQPKVSSQRTAVPASLSALGLQQKKDKGPSEQNLSSLRAALDAAMAGEKNPPTSKTETARAEGVHYIIPEKKDHDDRERESSHTVMDNTQSPSVANVRPKQQFVSQDQSSVQVTPQMAAQKDIPEVPEDVLRRVLSE